MFLHMVPSILRFVWISQGAAALIFILSTYRQFDSEAAGILDSYLVLGGGGWAFFSCLIGWRIRFNDLVSTIFIAGFSGLLFLFLTLFMYEKALDYISGMPGSYKYLVVYYFPWILSLVTLIFLALRSVLKKREV
mgnify:CR=1 FL=1